MAVQSKWVVDKYLHAKFKQRRSFRRQIFYGALVTLLTLFLIHLYMKSRKNETTILTNYNFEKYVIINGERIYEHYKWERHIDNPEKTVVIKWNTTKNYIIFMMRGKTKGYIGVGISFHNNMTNSDIVIGWIKDGKPYLHDFYAPGNGRPILDKQQDVELLHGEESDTHTTIYFRRKLDTCDEYDIKINWNTVRLIWALNDEDPTDEGPKYHGQNRGYTVTYMLGRQYELENTSDVKYVDVVAENITVRVGEASNYYCRLHKLIDVDEKHHLIGYEQIIQPENVGKVHHILLYLCYNDLLEVTYESKKGHVCQMTRIDTACMKRELASFSIGVDKTTYPPYVGIPFGSIPGEPMYIVFHIHYNTFGLENDFQDSSGLRLYYTKNLRPHDMDSINIAADYPQIIPSLQPAFSNFGICSSKCTENLFFEGGTNIFALHFHAHLTATTAVLHIIRGNKEIHKISDEHYDFGYQQIKFLKNEIKVYPNDIIAIECIYNTTNRQQTVFNGVSVINEMCILHLYLYPPVSYYYCTSRFSYKNLPSVIPKIPDIWTNNKYNQFPGIQQLLEGYLFLATNLILTHHSWTQKQADQLQEAYYNGDHYSNCGIRNATIHDTVKYPKFEPYIEEDICKNQVVKS